MMSIKINLYRAQALDNQSSDPCEWQGIALGAEASTDRKIAQSYASNISLKGREIYSEAWVNLFRYGNKFLLEIPCVEKDVAGRIAMVLCCGEMSEPVNDDEIRAVVNNLESFAHRIGRKVDTETMQRGIHALEGLKKNSTQVIIKLTYWITPPILLIMFYLIFTHH